MQSQPRPSSPSSPGLTTKISYGSVGIRSNIGKHVSDPLCYRSRTNRLICMALDDATLTATLKNDHPKISNI